MNRLVIPGILLSFIIACSEEKPLSGEGPGTDSCNAITLAPLALIDYRADHFTLKNVFIQDDQLFIVAAYGGGCGNAEFGLIVNETFMESDPVQTHVVIPFTDNDNCKAIVTTQVCFDLHALATAYRSSYQTPHGSIVLHVHDWPASIKYTF
jgi:hypothetical protein